MPRQARNYGPSIRRLIRALPKSLLRSCQSRRRRVERQGLRRLVDGHLHAIDAKTGKQIWDADTIIDHAQPYSSTGAVYMAGDLAVIGNSGADMDKGGVRGYVSAYDAETGTLK